MENPVNAHNDASDAEPVAPRRGPGRPKGSLNKLTAEVRELAAGYGPAVIRRLYDIVNDDEQPTAARVSAANVILDRGFGRPAQAVELTGRDGGPVETVRMSKAEFRAIALELAGRV